MKTIQIIGGLQIEVDEKTAEILITAGKAYEVTNEMKPEKKTTGRKKIVKDE